MICRSIKSKRRYLGVLVDHSDMGREVVGFSWGHTSCVLFDQDGDGTGRSFTDMVPTWSFPDVHLDTCREAVLSLTMSAVPLVATVIWKLFAQLPPCAQWSNTNRPVADSALPATNFLSRSDLTGAQQLDVTLLVKEVFADPAWRKEGRLNFWGEASAAFSHASFAITTPFLPSLFIRP